MRAKLQNLKSEAIAQIIDIDNLNDLERLRANYLGRKGKLTKVIAEISTIPKEQRKITGILVNSIKDSVEKAIIDQINRLTERDDEWFDPTIPGKRPNVGSLHLVTQAINEIAEIFKQIGFSRVRYPEVEWDWHAFAALNFPDDHPARDDWETFFVDHPASNKYGQMLLTPHTSSGQIREMKRVGIPPIRMLNIARTHRRQSDASHNSFFHQFEGLVIDKGINLSHLKGTLEYFVKEYFGPKINIRLRPHNFPFTEPSFEIDITCTICGGKGCKVCKEGWLEQTGAGMVHPNVLKAGGIDPKIYSGFAWGWGVERVLMMKPGLSIPDMRVLYSPDLKILRQF